VQQKKVFELRDIIARAMNDLIKEFKPEDKVLEIGGLDVNGTIRPLFPQNYISTDMREGKGVDEVLDIMDTFAVVEFEKKHGKFNTIVSCETFEHIENPFRAARNIKFLLKDNGLFFISVPFYFKIHDYSSDYFRYTPEGLKSVFKCFKPLKIVKLEDEIIPTAIVGVFKK
jgi:hypothetical protein